MTVYLDDTDFTGICYNSNYLKWMERARANAIGISTLADLRNRSDEEGGGVGQRFTRLSWTFKKAPGLVILWSYRPRKNREPVPLWRFGMRSALCLATLLRFASHKVSRAPVFG